MYFSPRIGGLKKARLISSLFYLEKNRNMFRLQKHYWKIILILRKRLK
nr:MAG TPA: hypothetical protein [Caudoviricetes sp.]